MRSPSAFAGKTVILNSTAKDPVRGIVVEGAEYRVEDWWDLLNSGKSWMFMDNNWACMHYGMRSGLAGLPTDDEVLYGHIGAYGHLVHISEIGEVVDGK